MREAGVGKQVHNLPAVLGSGIEMLFVVREHDLILDEQRGDRDEKSSDGAV